VNAPSAFFIGPKGLDRRLAPHGRDRWIVGAGWAGERYRRLVGAQRIAKARSSQLTTAVEGLLDRRGSRHRVINANYSGS
jgi:hypothetical protein